MKPATLLIATILFVAPFLALSLHHNPQIKNVEFNEPNAVANTELKSPLCSVCLEVMEQTISTLLNVILQGGVIGGCSALCSYVSQYGKIAVTACNLVCDIAGVEAFEKAIKAADLNHIWLCQEIDLCPIHDCKADVCAKFVQNNISPRKGPKGTTFQIDQVFQVLEQTGTGSLVFEVLPPSGSAFGDSQTVADGYQPGGYELKFSIKAEDNPEKKIEFPTGLYKTETGVCEGLCGSHHAHTRTLAVAHNNFTLSA